MEEGPHYSASWKKGSSTDLKKNKKDSGKNIEPQNTAGHRQKPGNASPGGRLPDKKAPADKNVSAKRKKRKRKYPLWVRILTIVVAAIFAAVLAGLIFVLAKLGQINRAVDVEKLNPESEYFETDEPDSNLETMDPEDVTWSNSETVSGSDDVVNILLIGQDRRPGEGRARSDAMIIASINKTDKTIKLTSLMRDMYVQIPGYSDNRINAAYAFGGMETLDATIKQNFDIDIDGNIEVDFSGFKEVIDSFGGIDMEIDADEIDVMNDYVRDINRQTGENTESSLVTQAGMQHLNGTQALAYSRIRYVGNGDFGRTERQRKVLMAAFDEVSNLSIPEMLSLADTVLPLLTTDMSSGDLIRLATDVLTLGISDIETHNIPEDASYRSASIRGMSVLVPDLDSCRRVLQEIIYGE